MDFNEILTQLIIGILGLIFSALGIMITALINKHIKDEELKQIITSLNDLVQKSVLDVYQTYVEALKKAGKFDAEAQKQALERCLELIKVNMPSELEKWLKSNYSNVESYLKSLIEAQIGLLKNQSK